LPAIRPTSAFPQKRQASSWICLHSLELDNRDPDQHYP
jgi:hypothetical protein